MHPSLFWFRLFVIVRESSHTPVSQNREHGAAAINRAEAASRLHARLRESQTLGTRARVAEEWLRLSRHSTRHFTSKAPVWLAWSKLDQKEKYTCLYDVCLDWYLMLLILLRIAYSLLDRLSGLNVNCLYLFFLVSNSCCSSFRRFLCSQELRSVTWPSNPPFPEHAKLPFLFFNNASSLRKMMLWTNFLNWFTIEFQTPCLRSDSVVALLGDSAQSGL